MLGIFKEKLVKAPKELNSPASLNSCTKPKLSHEILQDFMSCNSSNAFSMCFGNEAWLAYSPSNKPSIHQRLFSGLDKDILCLPGWPAQPYVYGTGSHLQYKVQFTWVNQEDDKESEGHRQILTKELEAVGLRLNKRPPQGIISTIEVWKMA